MPMQAEMRFVNNRESWQIRESLDRRTTSSMTLSRDKKRSNSSMNELAEIAFKNKKGVK